MISITIYEGDRPACSEPGCCHEHYISVNVGDDEIFEIVGTDIYNTDPSDLIKQVLNAYLKHQGQDFEITGEVL